MAIPFLKLIAKSPKRVFWSVTVICFVFIIRSKRELNKNKNVHLHDLEESVPIPADALQDIQYYKLNYQEENIIFSRSGSNLNRANLATANSSLKDFFNVLKSPQYECKKLVKFGGEVYCFNSLNSSSYDGFKYICLDDPLEIKPSSHHNSCIVLSFGVETEVSFDISMDDFSCEVHMFDILNYNKSVEASINIHFHAIGLGEKHLVTIYNATNFTYAEDNLDGHLRRLNLMGRAIHVLKIDIEEKEWKALEYLVSAKSLDFVGQIAIEFHITSFLSKTKTKAERAVILAHRLQLLQALEARGFKRVLFWETVVDMNAIFDEEGRRYEGGTEVLFVNQNWFNDSFKNRYKDAELIFS